MPCLYLPQRSNENVIARGSHGASKEFECLWSGVEVAANERAGCTVEEMHNPGTDITRESALLSHQQIISEGCQVASELAEFNGTWTDNGRDQVPIPIEEVNRAAVCGGGGVEGCGDGYVIAHRGDSRSKLDPDFRVRADECMQELSSSSIEEIDRASIIGSKVLKGSRNENVIAKACHRIAEEVA